MALKSSGNKTEQLVTTALMMTLILVGTIILRIPVPMTQGYVHLGDAMIYIGVLLLGRKNGTIAASLGSMMADILSGYAFWAPWTLVIKAAMAFIAGTFVERIPEHAEKSTISRMRLLNAAGMAAGGLVMTAGYFAAEGIMFGNWAAAALGIPWNIGQFSVGIAVGLSISAAVSRFRKA